MLYCNEITFWAIQIISILTLKAVNAESPQNPLSHNEIKDNRNISDRNSISRIEKCPCKINFKNAQSHILKLEWKLNQEKKRAEKEKLNLLHEIKNLRTEFRSLESKFDQILNGKILVNPIKDDVNHLMKVQYPKIISS